MRLATLGGAAAFVLATAIAGCSDQSGDSRSNITAPLAAPRLHLADGVNYRLHGEGSISIVTANGVIARALPSWTAAGSVREGIVRDETGSSPLGVIALSAHLIRPASAERTTNFSDAGGARLMAVWTPGVEGAPLRAMRIYRNGELQSTAVYDWTPVAGGWVLRSVTRRLMKDGKISAEFATSASGPVEMAARGLVSDVLAHLGAAAARAVTPRALSAQDVFEGRCRRETLNYFAAEATLAAAIAAYELTPSPGLAFAIMAASAQATNAEMAYWLCLQNEESRNNPIGPTMGLSQQQSPIACGQNPTMIDPMCSPPDEK